MKAEKPVLWIVCEVYYPEMTSTGHYLTLIAEHLAKSRTVGVICGQPNYASRGTIAPAREIRNGVEIFRVRSTRFQRSRVLGRLTNMLTLGVSSLTTALSRLGRGDEILVVTTPPTLPYNIALAGLAKGCSYTVLIHDAYPEQLIAVGALRSGSLPVRVLNLLNRWLYKHASRIIVVGRDMAELLTEKSAGLDIPISSIPNWGETDHLRPALKKDNLLIKKLGLADKFVFLVAGNLGWPTDVETLIEAAAKLSDEPSIHFLFVGGGVKLPRLEDEISRRGLTNVTAIGPLPREDQATFLNACDVGVVTLVPGMLGAAVPSRLYNLLAVGRPVFALVDRDSEVDRVISEEKIGWSMSSRDTSDVVGMIRQIHSERSQLTQMGKRARKVAETKYSPETALAAYEKIFN